MPGAAAAGKDADMVDYGASSYASRLTPRTEKGGGLPRTTPHPSLSARLPEAFGDLCPAHLLLFRRPRQ
jgi:hypothetical protein